MKRAAPTFYGLNAGQVTRIAESAVAKAVAANVRVGIPVTGLGDGRVQTLHVTDPRVAKFLQTQTD